MSTGETWRTMAREAPGSGGSLSSPTPSLWLEQNTVLCEGINREWAAVSLRVRVRLAVPLVRFGLYDITQHCGNRRIMVCPLCLVIGISPAFVNERSDTCAICYLDSQIGAASQEVTKALCEGLRSFV